MDRYSPIGIFDSGAGGVSVLRTAVSFLPNERFIFYGDSLNAPYGTKSADEVLALVTRVADTLAALDVKAIVIACNTATALAARQLRDTRTLPIIGMEPALKPASLIRKDGIVLVMATPNTLHSEKYARLYAMYGENALSLPCPGLMEFVERGETDSPTLYAYLDALFAPYKGAHVDAVVLGCTHYVFLRRAVSRFFAPDTAVIDGNEGTARQLKRRLEALQLLSDKKPEEAVRFLSSSGEKACALYRTLYGLQL